MHHHFMEHISDHDLERYYLGLILRDSEEEANVEEHLLWCHHCLARAEESDSYVDLIRGVLLPAISTWSSGENRWRGKRETAGPLRAQKGH